MEIDPMPIKDRLKIMAVAIGIGAVVYQGAKWVDRVMEKRNNELTK